MLFTSANPFSTTTCYQIGRLAPPSFFIPS